MKTKKEEFPARPAYKRYIPQFKEQALERADRDGIPTVSHDLGLAEGDIIYLTGKKSANGATL